MSEQPSERERLAADILFWHRVALLAVILVGFLAGVAGGLLLILWRIK